jgi:hypothetical protein
MPLVMERARRWSRLHELLETQDLDAAVVHVDETEQ